MLSALFVVSPHGFGHAARASAVIEALVGLVPGLRVDIATTVPEWFFTDALPAEIDLRLHPVEVDVGLVQRGPFDEDAAATAARLENVIGCRWEGVGRLAADLGHLRPKVIVADIAPLGLGLAARMGVPAVLLENFTWDFIYRAYGSELGAWAERLAPVSAAATLRIQAEPFCEPAAGALRVPPVARRRRSPRGEVRRRLGIPPDRPMVLVSMGGVPGLPREIERLRSQRRAVVVVPGGAPSIERSQGLIPLPHRSVHFHPDLVRDADLVVGKLGYSTVAETWTAGVPFAYVARDRFPESAPVSGWVEREMSATRIDRDELESGGWMARLEELLALPRMPEQVGGAAEAAAAIAGLMGIGEVDPGPT